MILADMNINVSAPFGSLELVIDKLLKFKLEINRVYLQYGKYQIDVSVPVKAKAFRREINLIRGGHKLVEPGYIWKISA